MLDFFRKLFGSDFMPHVYCLREPAVVTLHVVSDALTAAAYFAIPLVLLLIRRRRQDLVFPWMFGLFGVFIFACGSTHVLAIWTLWHPVYRLEGLVKAITATSSVMTAFLLYRLIPSIVLLPSPAQLSLEIAERRKVEGSIRQLNAGLEERVHQRTQELDESNAHLQALNAELTRSELRYRTLVEAMPQLVWTANQSGVEYLSRQWEEYTGIPEKAQLGDKWIRVLHPDDVHSTLELWTKAVETRTGFEAEYRIRKHDGTYRWFKGRGVPLGGPADTAPTWLGTSTDVDTEKRASTALAVHNSRLEDLAFATAHHLQEPVRNLRIQTQLLQRHLEGNLDEAGSELIGQMSGTMNRLRLLLQDFRAYSEVSTAHTAPRRFNVKGAIQSAIIAWRTELEALDAAVSLNIPELEAEGDAQQIQTVVEHLLGNAVKYRDAGRSLSLTVSAAELNRDIIVSVADNGIGIDPRFHATIFGLFKRLHKSEDYPGTGLGLAVCQRIIEAHGERLWVESQVGLGSTFHFTLKKAEPQYVS